jgi:DNA-binding protein HU-beta
MNKTELVAAIAEKANLTKKDSEAALVAMVEAVTEALAKGDKVQVIGFGSFEVKNRAARTGRNPKTKETIEIPASTSVTFKASKTLKDAVAK